MWSICLQTIDVCQKAMCMQYDMVLRSDERKYELLEPLPFLFLR